VWTAEQPFIKERTVMSKSIWRESTLWLVVLLGGMWTLTNLSACNTVEGMGEDIEDTGEAIEGGAEGAANS
jgi:predicted small secreted protein